MAEENIQKQDTETTGQGGGYWNREASELVLNELVRDVTGMDKSICCDTGRKLTPEQRPEGQHSGEKAKTLKPDQTPDQKDVLKSGIVEKSKGAVKKEAGSIAGPGKPDGTGPMGGTPECQMAEETSEKKKPEEKKAAEEEKTVAQQKAEERKEEKAEKKQEKAQEQAEETAEEALGKAEKLEEKMPVEASSVEIEGIELSPSMEDVTLSDEEAAKLNKLFA